MGFQQYNVDEDTKSKIIEMYEQGFSPREIVDHLQLPFDKSTLRTRLKEWGCAANKTKRERIVSGKEKAPDDREPILLPYVPHEHQQRFHDSKAMFRIISAGTRGGKDRGSIHDFIEKYGLMMSETRPAFLVPKVHSWIVAPTYALAKQSWRELKEFMPREWVDYGETSGKPKIREDDYTIETIGGGLIEVKSSDNPDQLVSVGLDMVLMTEFAKTKNADEVWAFISGRLSSPGRGPGGKGGIATVNSTPKRGPTGVQFRKLFEMGLPGPMKDPDFESFHWESRDNPYFTAEEWERNKRTLPQYLFDQEFRAIFLSGEGAVFPHVTDLVFSKGKDIYLPYREEPEPGEVYVAAWDPARHRDYAGMLIRNSKGRVVFLNRFQKVDWSQQLYYFKETCSRYNHAHAVIDSTGLGDVVLSALLEQGVDAEGVQMYPKEKSEMVNHLVMLMEQEPAIISYPNNNELVGELRDYTFTALKSGGVRYEAPAGQHDDLVTVMMLGYKDYSKPEEVLPFLGILVGAQRKRR